MPAGRWWRCSPILPPALLREGELAGIGQRGLRRGVHHPPAAYERPLWTVRWWWRRYFARDYGMDRWGGLGDRSGST